MKDSILLSAAHYPVTVLGYGKRLGIWLQGCSIHCKGCMSRDTWEFDESRRIPIATFQEWAVAACGGDLDGITISGGEPFDHPDDLLALSVSLRRWLEGLPARGDGMERDILCYSGYTWSRLARRHPDLLARFDAVISGAYVESKPVAHLRGSSNQAVNCITVLGLARYGRHRDVAIGKAMQVFVDARHRMWAIGIPEREVMNGLRTGMLADGIEMDGVSWR